MTISIPKYIKMHILLLMTALAAWPACALSSDIVPSKTAIDFGMLNHCESPADTIQLRNYGAANRKIFIGEAISGANPECFAIVNPKKNDMDLPPYDGTNALVYVVRYIPAPADPGPKSAQLTIKTDDPLLPEIKIDLKGESEKFVMSVTPDTIDFGKIAVGQQVIDMVTLHNSSAKDKRIFRIINNNPCITLEVSDSLVSTGSSVAFINTILNVPVPGKFLDSITIVMEGPCFDTLRYLVKAEVIAPTVNIPEAVDIGMVSPCDSIWKTIVFKNKGFVKATIYSISLFGGPDKDYFELRPDGLSYPLSLDPGMDLPRIIVFRPIDDSEGVKTAFITISCDFNGSRYDTTIFFRAEVVKVKLPDLSLELPEAQPGTAGSTVIPVQNKLKLPVKILKVHPASKYKDVILPGTLIENDTIAPSGTDTNLVITFRPKIDGDYTDSVRIDYSCGSCLDSFFIVAHGRASKADTIDFSIGSIECDPVSGQLIDIPVFVSHRDKNKTLAFSSDTIEVRFNRTVVYPKAIKSGAGSDVELLSITEEQDEWSVIMAIPRGIKPEDSSAMAAVRLLPLLGDEEISAVKFGKVVIKGIEGLEQPVIGKTDAGKIKTKICKAGGDRLISYTAGNPPIAPAMNPARDEMKFRLNLFEQGTWSLEVYNTSGSLVASRQLPGLGPERGAIDAGGLAPGLYLALLKSPAGLVFMAKVVVE